MECDGGVPIGLDTYLDASDSSTMGNDAITGSTIERIPSVPSGLPTSVEPVMVIIPEARQRQQKRHRAVAWIVVALFVVAVLGYAVVRVTASGGQSGNPSPTSPIPSVPAGAFSGIWSLHTDSLTISSDGRGSIVYPFDVRCGRGIGLGPFPCDVWTADDRIMPGGHAQITLTKVGRTAATGMITRSDDQGIIPDGTFTLRLRAVYGVPILYVISMGRPPSASWLTHSPLCSQAARKYYVSHTDLTAPDLQCGA